MAKKKTAGEKTRQINFRVPESLGKRLDATAEALATDVSHLLRNLVAECLPEFEDRAERARGHKPKTKGPG